MPLQEVRDGPAVLDVSPAHLAVLDRACSMGMSLDEVVNALSAGDASRPSG